MLQEIALMIALLIPMRRARCSWYGPGFHGRQTAGGDYFDMDELTCAHKTLPLGTVVLFVAEDGSHEVARVTDRGPYVGLREFDFSRALADSLGDLDDGLYDVYWAVVGRDTSGLPYARGG